MADHKPRGYVGDVNECSSCGEHEKLWPLWNNQILRFENYHCILPEKNNKVYKSNIHQWHITIKKLT